MLRIDIAGARLVCRAGSMNDQASVRLSVRLCPVVRQPLWRAAGLLLSAQRAGPCDLEGSGGTPIDSAGAQQHGVLQQMRAVPC